MLVFKNVKCTLYVFFMLALANILLFRSNIVIDVKTFLSYYGLSLMNGNQA